MINRLELDGMKTSMCIWYVVRGAYMQEVNRPIRLEVVMTSTTFLFSLKANDCHHPRVADVSLFNSICTLICIKKPCLCSAKAHISTLFFPSAVIGTQLMTYNAPLHAPYHRKNRRFHWQVLQFKLGVWINCFAIAWTHDEPYIYEALLFF